MVTDSPDVSVIVPTYCEVENLPTLIPQIDAAMRQEGLHYEIILVDDNSQDGSIAVCLHLAQHFSVRLITRRAERGLASAVICGLQAAQGEVLVVMDADLSHPPDAIPALVNAVRSPFCDFSIGSRYVAGGSIDSNWTLFRHLNSRIASWLAHGLTSAKDPMSGFFAIKRETFEHAEKIRPLGYKIGLELLVRCDCRRVVEVPIAFRDRTHGNSKLTLGQQWLYLRHLGRLYPTKYAGLSPPARFGLVGLSGMAVDLAAFALLRSTVSFALARAFAIWIAITWNFFLHRSYTFQTPIADSGVRQYGKFAGVCLLGASVNWMVSILAASTMPMFPGHVLVASVTGILAGAGLNYGMWQRRALGHASTAVVPPIIKLQNKRESESHFPVKPTQIQRKKSA